MSADATAANFGNSTRGAAPWRWRGRGRGLGVPVKLALDFDVLESEQEGHPYDTLRSRNGFYDPKLLEALAKLHGSSKREILIHELRLQQIELGMVFGEDVRSSKGLLLTARGQQVTLGLQERVRNFSAELGVCEPIRMIVKAGGDEATSEAEAEALAKR